MITLVLIVKVGERRLRVSTASPRPDVYKWQSENAN
jgi:hypothetical protein